MGNDTASYLMYKEMLPTKAYLQSCLRGNLCETDLARAFYSRQNIDIIQNALRFKVWERSSKVIDRQSDDELVIVMRATFLQRAKHLNTDISGQISELNNSVISKIIPSLLSEISGHILYLKDKFAGLSPLPPPINVNSAGLKSLPSVTQTF